MASKRKVTDGINESDYESNDSDIVPVIKRKKINDFEDSDVNDSQAYNSIHTAKYVRIMEDEYDGQDGSCDFVEKSGAQCFLPDSSKPIEYFNLFFTPSLWTLMVEETNRYAEELLTSSEISAMSRMRNWYPVTVLEMKAFVAVLLEMGITRRPTMYSYWTENSRSIPWFKQMFSRNRFQLILKCFHLVNNEECFPPNHEKYDACTKFNPIVEHANKIFKLYYTPHKELSINESLVGTLCHSSITQNLPNKKHHKWGIKFWMLCDAVSNYCITFYCYQGAKSKVNNEIKRMGLGYNIVVNLLQQSDCLNKGHHVYTDNFFTSTELANFLYSKNTYLTGTIRRNKKDLPNDAKEIKVGETKYFQNNEVVLCSYHEKKNSKKPVFLISTQTSIKNVTVNKTRRGKERQKIKPPIVHAYDSCMGGVDECDTMLYTYLDEHCTLKYWKKVIFNIFARMVLNSYIIYKEIVGRKAMSRLQYTSHIISEIEREWKQETNQSIINEKKTYGLTKLPGRNLRQCVVCSNKAKGIRRSNLICVICEKGLHPLCFHKHICT